MRTEKELYKYLEEAECRVSWVRKTHALNRIANGADLMPVGFPSTQEEWVKKRMELLDQGFKALQKKCVIDAADPLSGWSYEYWEGIMAALRWVLGEDKNSRDT